jgi:hypothetical protein
VTTWPPWTLEFRPQIDFAVWSLQIDGLSVGPFDRHGPGTHALVSSGLSKQAWRLWVTSLVSAFERARYLTTIDADAEFIQVSDRLESPWEFATGPREVRTTLEEMWGTYLTQRRDRARNARAEQMGRMLLNYTTRLDGLSVFAVDYVTVTSMAVGPRSVLVSMGSSMVDTPSGETLVATLESALEKWGD